MGKKKSEKPFTVKCPNCGKTVEPDRNETTGSYLCPVCTARVDIQVIIEKKKRGIR
ncbi:MAG TPA: hypothetical protein VK470_06460 [Bacteroidota bacterium]|nr:hypothetical protein [Bacteroidota bacterium]